MIKNLSILNMRKERKNKLLFIFLCFIFLFTLVLSLKVPVKAYQEGPYSKETIDNITGSYRPDLWYLKDNYLYFTFEHISMLNPNTGLATNFTSYISMGLHSFIFNEPIQYEFYYMGQWMPKTFYEGIFMSLPIIVSASNSINMVMIGSKFLIKINTELEFRLLRIRFHQLLAAKLIILPMSIIQYLKLLLNLDYQHMIMLMVIFHLLLLSKQAIITLGIKIRLVIM